MADSKHQIVAKTPVKRRQRIYIHGILVRNICSPSDSLMSHAKDTTKCLFQYTLVKSEAGSGLPY